MSKEREMCEGPSSLLVPGRVSTGLIRSASPRARGGGAGGGGFEVEDWTEAELRSGLRERKSGSLSPSGGSFSKGEGRDRREGTSGGIKWGGGTGSV